MLIMAAQTFHATGLLDVDAIEKAYLTLEPLLGQASSQIFALPLLMAGLSSLAVGTMSGQVIMQGFLNFSGPGLVKTAGDHGSGPSGHLHRARSDPDLGHQSGGLELRPARGGDPPGAFHQAAGGDGHASQQSADPALESLAAGPIGATGFLAWLTICCLLLSASIVAWL